MIVMESKSELQNICHNFHPHAIQNLFFFSLVDEKCLLYQVNDNERVFVALLQLCSVED